MAATIAAIATPQGEGSIGVIRISGENAIIKYSPREGRILLRVGGGEATAFENPCAVTLHG